MKLTILSSGTWGTALAIILAKAGHEVTVQCYTEEELKMLSVDRIHKNLPGAIVPDEIEFTMDIHAAVKDAKIIICAAPSIFVRSTIARIKDDVKKEQIIVSVAKGIEEKTLYTMSEVIEDELTTGNPVVALSGPTHAEEVALSIPTLIVSASKDPEAAKKVQELFSGTCIRTYTNSDIKGVEICGALKNIIALACGISDGLGYGDNSKAAIITRGLAEISRLGLKMGCSLETFSGLSGVGDLIVTCTSRHSRNYNCGHFIGEGIEPEEAIKKVGMVVEGINAIRPALKLTEKYEVELPITNGVNAVIFEKYKPDEVVKKLFERSLKSELQYEKTIL